MDTQQQNEKRVALLYRKYGDKYKSLKFFLDDFKSVVRIIQNAYSNVNTRSSYIGSVIVIGRQENISDRAIQYYKGIANELRGDRKKKEDNNVKPENCQLVSKQDITDKAEALMDKMFEVYGLVDTRTKPENSMKQWLSDYQDAVVLFWYSKQPPTRLEIFNASLIDDTNRSEVSGNWIDLDLGKYNVTTGKNIKSIGNQSINIHPDITQLLRDFKEATGQDTFTRFKTPHLYGMYITRIFKKYFGYDKVTMNVLRHSQATYWIQSAGYQQLTNKQKDQLHLTMLHSSTVAHRIYNYVAECPRLGRRRYEEPDVPIDFHFN